MRRFLAALVTASAVGAAALIVLPASTPAFAVNCPSPFTYDEQGFHWTHTNASGPDVMGVRAGVKFRKDANLCDPGMLGNQRQWVQIGVEGTGGPNNIVSMGFVQRYNVFDLNEWCKVWFIGDAVEHRYGCTGINQNDEVNFSIHQDGSHTHYVLDDCGLNTTGYGNCSTMNQSQADWAEPHGTIFQAEQYGACTQHMFGAQGDQEKVGSPTGPILPIQGLDSSFQWDPRQWGTQSDLQTCQNGGNYNWYLKDTTPTHGVNWYDSRN
jgi:hypothetical protein